MEIRQNMYIKTSDLGFDPTAHLYNVQNIANFIFSAPLCEEEVGRRSGVE